MSYQSCPSCGGAPAPDRTCKLCGRAGPSTAITQAELDAINARVAELKKLLDDKYLSGPMSTTTPLTVLVTMPTLGGTGPRLLAMLATPSDDEIRRELGWYEYSTHFVGGEIVLDEAAELTDAQFDYLLERARDKKEGDE